MVSKGQIVAMDWNRIARLHGHTESSSSSVVEHPTRSRRVVDSNPIWNSDFFRVNVSPRIYIISCCCYFSVSIIVLVFLFVCLFVCLFFRLFVCVLIFRLSWPCISPKLISVF